MSHFLAVPLVVLWSVIVVILAFLQDCKALHINYRVKLIIPVNSLEQESSKNIALAIGFFD